MAKLNLSNDFHNTQPSDFEELASESLKHSREHSLSLMKHFEIWMGRLAMFGLTTTLVAIAIHPH